MSGKARKVFQVGFFYASVFALLLVDQLSKAYIRETMRPGDSIPLLKNIFHITLVHNTGAAFGVLKAFPWLFVWTSAIAAVFINFLFLKLSEKMNVFEVSGLCLILSGTLGNLADRLSRGFVLDFIDFRVWPVFNFADTWISIGAVLLGVGLLAGYGKKQTE